MAKKSNKSKTKYIVVTGGVLSGIGKGITAASLGALLNCAGQKITMQKLEPYLSVDSGMLSPKTHGECFVTFDGKETDMDLGHYERFTGVDMNKKTLTISGVMYQELFERERRGEYEGKTTQVVPQLTNLIKEKLFLQSTGSDVHVVEIGGTVGDFESVAIIEAVREFSNEVGRENCIFVHVAYVPFLKISQEFKTKPLQNSVRDLREFGITPDLIIARCEEIPTNRYIERKTAPFVGVKEDQIIVMPNADTIYRVPQILIQKNIHNFLFEKFKLKVDKKVFEKNFQDKWTKVLNLFDKSSTSKKEVRIGIVAKYLDNADSYYSVIESMKIAAWHAGVKLNYDWVDAEKLEGKKVKEVEGELKKYDGILVPGGFGNRGIEGKISAAAYSLENKVPYMGICLGLQVAVIAAARNAGVKNANSEEFDKQAREKNRNVVYIMNDQVGKENTGGTMRLGTYKCVIEKDTLAHKTFAAQMKEKGQKDFIEERHRHRYEVNQSFKKEIESAGLKISGTSPDGKLVELIETHKNINHPFFLATQSHPEFLSRPWAAHPMFLEFIKACSKL
jgi:CTP synthase